MMDVNIVHLSMWVLVISSRAYGNELKKIENILLSSTDLTFLLAWSPVSLSKNYSDSAVIYNVMARISYGVHKNIHYFDKTSLPTLEFHPPRKDNMYRRRWQFIINATMDGQLIAEGKSRKYYGLDSVVTQGSLSHPQVNMTFECDAVTMTLDTQNDELRWYDWAFQIRYFNATSSSQWMAEMQPIFMNTVAQINLTIPSAMANVCIEARYRIVFVRSTSNTTKVCADRQCSSTTEYPEIINKKTVPEFQYLDYSLIIITSVAFIITVFMSLCLIKICLRNQLKNENNELPETMKQVIDVSLENGIYSDDEQQEETVLEMDILEEPPSAISNQEHEPLLLWCAKSKVSPKTQITDESESHTSETVDESVTQDNCSNDATRSTDTSEKIILTDMEDNNKIRSSAEGTNYSQINLMQYPEILGVKLTKKETVDLDSIAFSNSVDGDYILKSVK